MKGHVTKRGNKYYAVMSLRDGNGVRKQKWFSGFDTRKAAHEFISQKVLEIKRTGHGATETLGTFIQAWFTYQKTRLRPGTVRSYSWLISRYIVPRFGECRLSDITPEQIQSYYFELLELGLSNQTVLNLHRVLKNALNRAVLWDRVRLNAAALVQPPRVTTPIFDTWTPEQLKAFLRSSECSKYHVCFLILASTGMRLGEVQALRWSDCDLENGIIRVRRTMTYTGKAYRVDAPKSKRGVRSISLPSVVSLKLWEYRQQQTTPSPDSLICATASGQPVLQHNLRMLFYQIVERAGLPRIRIHDLRHTHATLLLAKGIHPKIVQERLGHASVETTLNIYSHVLPHLQESAARAFNEYLL